MDWRHRSACLDEDPELFFPIGNTGPAILQIEEAKVVCRRCDVREQCLHLGSRVGSGPRRLGRHERGRAAGAEAAHRTGPPAHRLSDPQPAGQAGAPAGHASTPGPAGSGNVTVATVPARSLPGASGPNVIAP